MWPRKKRKALSSKKVAEAKAARTPKRSPEKERSVVLDARSDRSTVETQIPFGNDNKKNKAKLRLGGAGSRHGEREDRELETLASELIQAGDGPSSRRRRCRWSRSAGGRMWASRRCSIGMTGTRRSIVGDEPGITRDRIYGEIEWAGRMVRVVDTGGVVPDDEALIPSGDLSPGAGGAG